MSDTFELENNNIVLLLFRQKNPLSEQTFLTFLLSFSDTYDCLGISGGMGPGHILSGALQEMSRIVKPGNIAYTFQIRHL